MTATEATLEELLRKAHREELLPLAKAVGVNPRGLGLETLARHLARTIRRKGANGMANLVKRRGEGPSYDEVLAGLAERIEIDVAGSHEETELALLSAWVERAWVDMDPADREAVWGSLGMSPPTPEQGEEAMQLARVKHGRAFAYTMGVGAVTSAARVLLLFTPFGPLMGCLGLWFLARPRDDKLLPALLEVTRLRQQLLHRVTVGVVGSPSCGKDAAIKALFGVDTGNIDPVAGATKTVEITRLPGATALYVVNTPGLGDVVEEVTEEARQVLDHIDLYVYIVNAQGGVQARELADYQACVASGRPVLAVINKVDTLRDADRERYLADALQKLGAPEADFIPAAFDPLPQLAETPLGVDVVHRWLHEHLVEAGKDPAELAWCQPEEPNA